MEDPFDLARFMVAQDPVFDAVRAELCAGRKRTHWMWFVFPQLRGLGHSSMAQRFGIASLDEARAYLAHTVLGSRLVECTELVNAVEGCSAHDIFGSPDDLKFRSSMTLFAVAAKDSTTFNRALARYFQDAADPATLDRLRPQPGSLSS